MSSEAKFVFMNAILFVFTCCASERQAACRGESLYARYGIIAGESKSPDARKTLTTRVTQDDKDATGFYVSYRLRTERQDSSTRVSGWNPEVLWSPDSRRFAVNQTTGGGGIGQRAYIFDAEDNTLRRLNLFAVVRKAFGSRVKCEVQVPPNTAVLQWLDSKRVLVVAEVVNVSVCACKGTYKTYEISVPDLRILRTYTQAETKRLFGSSLGCELRNADDLCAKSWQE